MSQPRFTGTRDYIADEDLLTAVNAAITLERPLLIKGEPGTGKTRLAEEVAQALGRELIVWPVKSTTKAQHGLYEYDAVSRLRDAQLGEPRASDIGSYIVRGRLWEAFEAATAPVLLIDEIDKADIEFPNDLLRELDQIEFFVHETKTLVKARQRPIIIITSNNEKELPDAFLRRRFFHYIRFPDRATLAQIVNAHYPDLRETLLAEALEVFLGLREAPSLRKKPSTSELLDWMRLLDAAGIAPETLSVSARQGELPPFAGALLKNEQDLGLVARVLAMVRR